MQCKYNSNMMQIKHKYNANTAYSCREIFLSGWWTAVGQLVGTKNKYNANAMQIQCKYNRTNTTYSCRVTFWPAGWLVGIRNLLGTGRGAN